MIIVQLSPVQWPFYGYTVRFRPWCWVLACFSSIIHYDCWWFTPKQNVCSRATRLPGPFFGNRFRRLFFGNVYSQPPRCPHCFHILVILSFLQFQSPCYTTSFSPSLVVSGKKYQYLITPRSGDELFSST